MLQALVAGHSLAFFLYDPMTVILSGFTCISLLLWGRGTFCGWLCPFGALQEFSAKLGRLLSCRKIRFKPATDRRLKWLKYPVLAAILGSALIAPQLTDMVVEVEPFKTAITLNFVRSWPFVVYALGLLIAGMIVFKPFCRYLCPLGAGLAVLDAFACWPGFRAARLRQTVPDLPLSMFVRGHRHGWQDCIRRMLPMHGMRRHLCQRPALRAADAGKEARQNPANQDRWQSS